MEIDPFLLTEEAIDPEVQAFIRALEFAISQQPDTTGWNAGQLRDQRRKGGGVFGKRPFSFRARNRTIPGPVGDLNVRVVEPKTPARGVYLHFHGGGWVLGDSSDQDDRLVRLADDHGLVTFSIDYRLAPEDPYPAAPDDCEAAARWLVDNAQAEYGTDTLLIGDESAGAHLAAVTLVRMRDRHGYSGFAGANLVYGAFDMAMTEGARGWGDRQLILSTPIMQWYNDQFLPAGLERSEPDISPLNADLTGLCPALFTVGTLDPLLDDSLLMAEAWQAGGNTSDIAVYPGGVHAFDYFDTTQANEPHGRVSEFIERYLA
jgi:acetyl esterase